MMASGLVHTSSFSGPSGFGGLDPVFIIIQSMDHDIAALRAAADPDIPPREQVQGVPGSPPGMPVGNEHGPGLCQGQKLSQIILVPAMMRQFPEPPLPLS